MSSQWMGQHGSEPPNAGQVPVVTSILKDFSAEALGELRTWLEQNPPSISVRSIIGYQQQTQSARVHKSAVQSIATGVTTVVTWDVVEFDYGGLFPSGATSRLSVRLDGKYVFGAGLVYALNTTGSRYVQLFKNATTSVASMTVPTPPSAGLVSTLNISTVLDLRAGDFVEVRSYQDSGVSLNISTELDAHFWAVRVGG